jgi:predicted PurR-regulated permease PerM
MPAESARALVAWTIAMVALAVALVWALWVARQALLLVYVSSLLAIGFSPVVRMLERQRVVPIGSRRVPRWLAILIVYLVPKLMEQQVGLSAAGVIVALLLGGSLLGIPGAILAVPTAAIVQVLFQELVAPEAH